MREAAIRFGAALTIAAAGVSSAQATSSAEPVIHQVTYKVTTNVDANFNLYYLAAEPASQAALDADPSAFFRNDKVFIVPGAPWVFQTTLQDTQWAIITAGSAHRVAPNPSCEIAIDGQVVVQQSGLSGAQCAMRPW